MRYRYRPPAGLWATIIFIVRRLLARLNPDREECPPERPLISFIPGQIVLLAEIAGADADVPEPQLRQQIAEQLRFIIDKLDLPTCVKVAPERVTLLRGKNRTVAVATATAPEARLAPGRLLQLVRQINRQLPRLKSRGERYNTATSDSPDKEPVRLLRTQLQVASPNWLMSGTPQSGGVGGPGARPVPFSPPASPAPGGTTASSATTNALEPWCEFNLPPLPPPEVQPFTTREVDVVILDTAPIDVDLTRAWNTWGTSNTLLRRLLEPNNGKLVGANGQRRVYYADYSHIQGEVDVDLYAHQYLMPDHGLFVAGTINAIAPNARLHLVEVLNHYGVGSVQHIAAGFARALQIATDSDGPVIVNASLVLNLPQNPALLEDLKDRVVDLATLTANDIPDMSALLEQLCLLLADSNVVVVAAAGNNGIVNGARVDAAFPAAFESVVGVGALDHDTIAAAYSNKADSPVSAGIATFGGGANGTDADGNGMIGLYIGTFPPNNTASQSGWARWAGTSFATPVIAGVLAKLVAQGPLATPDPLKPLRDAYTAVGDTGAGEVFPVTQG